jgi:hypothetical protein
MEKRDYLMDQIEQLGKALALILSKWLGLKSQGKVTEAIEMTNQSLKDELGMDIAELSAIPAEDFVMTMKVGKKFNYTNLERLADILSGIADALEGNKTGNEQSLNLYAKCLSIYNYLNEYDLTFSFERQAKIERISSLLI